MFPVTISCCVCLLVYSVITAHGVIINVSNTSGEDSQSCMQGHTNCSTLSYVLSQLTNQNASLQSNVIINIYDDQQLDNVTGNGFVFSNADNIAINGMSAETVTISCLSIGTGLYFNSSTNITIHHLTWINCGVWHPTTANAVGWINCSEGNCDKLRLPKALSAIFAYNCSNLILDHTHFTSNIGSGVSLYNVGGVVSITDCWFRDHSLNGTIACGKLNKTVSFCSPQSIGLYIEFTYCPEFTQNCMSQIDTTSMLHAHYYIQHCHFHGNNNPGAYRLITDIPTPMEVNDTVHWPFGRGGGMGVVLKVYQLKHFHLIVNNNTFTDNTAVYGGGFYMVLQSGFPDHNYYTLTNNTFQGNEAYYNGGGACIEINIRYDTDISCDVLNKWLRNYLYIGQTDFTDNKAYWGGGVAFTAYPLNATYLDFQICSCTFNNNQFSGGGGALALLRKEKPEKELAYIAKVQLYNCTFEGTRPVLITSESGQFIPSTVHSEGIEMSFHQGTYFGDNFATALRLSDTGAVLWDTVVFYRNIGFNGGGVALYGKSWLTLSHTAEVYFTNNLAHKYGGGIYYDPAPVMNMNMTGSCFVWYKPPEGTVDVPVEDWWSKVWFEGNHASQCGNAAYISDLQQCIWPGQLSLFNPNRTDVFNYTGQHGSHRIICTPTKRIQFVPSKYIPAGKYTPPKHDKDYAKYRLMPGESVQLELVTMDSLNQRVEATVLSVICFNTTEYEMSSKNVEDACGRDSDYQIDSFNRQVLSGSTLKNFKVYGPEITSDNLTHTENTSFILVFKTNDPLPLVLPLLIEFTICGNGYLYNKENKSCECLHNQDDDLPAIVCSNAEPMLDIGTPCIKQGYWYGNIDHILAYHFCHNDRCQGKHNHCDNYEGYVKVPIDEDELCSNDLKGPLCSKCSSNGTSSLSYNSYRCMECSGVRSLGLILLMLMGCLLVVVLIIGFVKLNIRIPTASFYSFLYFYSVVNLLLMIPMPDALEAAISVIVGVASLDFQILQYMNMCFHGFSAIHYEVLHYIYPVAIGGLIFLVIKLDQSGWRRYQFFSGETATQALCLILLIVYTSISSTSLHILLPLRYQTPNGANQSIDGWYVFVDPGVKYLDTTHHLPFWLLAMVVEVFLVFPFSLLLFLAPWLQKCVNLLKIKPILDEYHNCFHDNCRWFAGMYLLARQVMFLIVGLARHPSVMAYLQQSFSLCLLILVATLQPYQQRLLNIIDTLLLSLLTFLSFTASGNRGYNNHTSVQLAVVGIACLLPFVLLLGVVTFYKFRALSKKTSLVTRFRQKLKLKSFTDESGHQLENDDSSNTSGSYDKTLRQSSRTDSSRMGDDLPPRFYEEEHTQRTERSPLLQTEITRYPKGMANYSINRAPATN